MFFSTDRALYRAQGADFEPVFELPCDGNSRVWSVWGNSATEVFLAYETGNSTIGCGDIALKWWDGRAWHAL